MLASRPCPDKTSKEHAPSVIANFRFNCLILSSSVFHALRNSSCFDRRTTQFKNTVRSFFDLRFTPLNMPIKISNGAVQLTAICNGFLLVLHCIDGSVELIDVVHVDDLEPPIFDPPEPDSPNRTNVRDGSGQLAFCFFCVEEQAACCRSTG